MTITAEYLYDTYAPEAYGAGSREIRVPQAQYDAIVEWFEAQHGGLRDAETGDLLLFGLPLRVKEVA